MQVTIDATLAEANAAISAECCTESRELHQRDRRGRQVRAAARRQSVNILGLRNARTIIDAALAGLPEDAPERAALEQVSRFARLAADNLDLSEADPRLDRQAGPGQADVVEGTSVVARRVRAPRSR